MESSAVGDGLVLSENMDDDFLSDINLISTLPSDTSQFQTYEKVDFNNLRVCTAGIYEGVYNILSSSILLLRSPSDLKNLSFRSSMPSDDSWELASTREEFRKLMVPTLTLENISNLSQSFLFTDHCSLDVSINHNSFSQIDALTCFNVDYTTTMGSLIRCQQKFNNSVCVMYAQSEVMPTRTHLKCDSIALRENCVMVFCKTSSFDTDQYFCTAQPASSNEANPMVTVKMAVYICQTDENKLVFQSIIQQEKATIFVVDQISQFLKTLKILSIPTRPTFVDENMEYNLSLVYDAVINPNLFFDVFSTKNGQSLKEKFDILMDCDKVCLLLLDGAPGTGKTTSASNVIADYVKNSIAKDTAIRILVTAPSNAAADVFYLKLRTLLQNITICRLGEKENFKPKVREFLHSDFNEFVNSHAHTYGRDAPRGTFEREFVENSFIVVVTLGSSMSSDLLKLSHSLQFDLLVVDECGQAKMDELLFPFHFTTISRLFLIGDPKQLGPTLKSSLMMNLPANKTSVFVKLYTHFQQKSPGTIIRLRNQHRMHPFVANVVNHISYADTDHIITDPKGNWKKIKNQPPFLVFSGESWLEKRTIDSFSFENLKEAEFGMALLRASLQQNGFNFNTRKFPENKQLNYTIIPLYKGQANLYCRLLIESHLDQVVDVFTVDKMQGSECDIAIVSAVRASTEHHSVGFASDLRRLNVALSRAACVYVLAKYDDFKLQQGWSKLFFNAILNNCLFPDADHLLKNGFLLQVLSDQAYDVFSMDVD